MFLFRNAMLLDPRFDEPRGGYEILVENGRFREVSDRPIKAANARVIDCGGRTLMPGLIDCHVHVYLSEVNISLLEHIPVSLLAGRAAPLMLAMLNRGFTTVRDTGGADWGILGTIAPGAIADLIVVDGDPLKDLGLLQDQGARLSLIMKEGYLHKDRLQ